MKKIKHNIKEKQKAPMEKRTKIILLSAIGVLVLAFVIMIILESKSGSIKIINNTDMSLEYVEVHFVDSEGPASDSTVFQNFEPGDDIFQKRDEVDLLGKEANLEIRFKFKDYDEEMFVDSGYFNDRFGGNIKIKFTQKDDEIVKLSVKASNGFIPSTLIQCDEIHSVKFKEGFIEE